MARKISGITPLLIITLLSIGLVEGGYQLLEHLVLSLPDARQMEDVVSPEGGTPVITDDGQVRDHTIILRRNLFGPPPSGPKPVEVVSDYTANLETSTLNVVLMGTITGSEGATRAFILDKKKNDQQLYETGDAVQGAIIKEILRGKVILTFNGQDEILDMSEAAKVRPKVQPVDPRAALAAGQANSGLNPQAQGYFPPGHDNSLPRAVVPGRNTPGQSVERKIVRPRIIRPARRRNDS